MCSQALGDQIIFVTRPDKKKILFYNDKHCQFAVDEGEEKSTVIWVILFFSPTFIFHLGCLHFKDLVAVGFDNELFKSSYKSTKPPWLFS